MTVILLGLYQALKRQWIFVVTTVMMTIGLIVSFYALVVYDSYHLPTKKAKEILNYDIDNIYKINFGTTILGLNDEDIIQAKRLYNLIKQHPDIIGCGGYFYSYSNQNKLYVNEMLIDLCKVRNINGEQLTFDYTYIGSGVGIAFVGENIAEQYPLGSYYYDKEMQCQYYIAGIVDQESEWLSNDLLSANNMNLGDYIILDLDFALEHPVNELYYYNAFCNFVLIAENNIEMHQIENIINEISLDIDGVYSLKDLYLSYEEEAMNMAGEDYILPFVLLLSAIVVAVITSRMSILSNTKDYGIMLSNGFTKIELIVIVCVENIIRCFCSYLLAVVYWEIQYLNMDSYTRILYDDTSTYRFLIIMFILLLTVEFPIRYLLKNKPIELITTNEF